MSNTRDHSLSHQKVQRTVGDGRKELPDWQLSSFSSSVTLAQNGGKEKGHKIYLAKQPQSFSETLGAGEANHRKAPQPPQPCQTAQGLENKQRVLGDPKELSSNLKMETSHL